MPIQEDPPPGVPEWVVTYGDMMSLLLTFFIMLVSLSELKGDKKYQQMVESIMKYMGYRTGPQSVSGESFPLNSAIEKLKKLGAQTKTGEGKGGIKLPGPEGSDLRVFKSKEGTSISLGGPVLFANGSADLTPEATEHLKSLAVTLAGKPNKIDIRGHCSDQPLPADSKYNDKFRLSYERARSVWAYLQTQGISVDRMRLSAAGDSEPVAVNVNGQPTYIDRVELFVLDAFARDFVGPRAAVR